MLHGYEREYAKYESPSVVFIDKAPLSLTFASLHPVV